MIKAIIIDDEINGVEILQYLIKENCPSIHVIATETNPIKAVDLIEQYKPDVVFLDIEMPNMSGFEWLEQVKQHSFYVIFITAYSQYALKAFKYNTVDYLLKPIIAEELMAAVTKLSLNLKTNSPD